MCLRLWGCYWKINKRKSKSFLQIMMCFLQIRCNGLTQYLWTRKNILFSSIFSCYIGRFLLTARLFSKHGKKQKETRLSFAGQQWSEDNQVGRLADGNGDFEGNGIFSKLLLDVSSFSSGFTMTLCRYFGQSLECILFTNHSWLLC